MTYTEYLLQAKSKKISEHFTLYDACYSETAVKNKIDNTPMPQTIINATLLANKCLEPIYAKFKGFKVNCIYRSPILNTKIGGAVNSQHRFGQACDFVIPSADLKIVFTWCKANLKFDQLILENGWIHISFTNGKNRQQTLKLVNGTYLPA